MANMMKALRARWGGEERAELEAGDTGVDVEKREQVEKLKEEVKRLKRELDNERKKVKRAKQAKEVLREKLKEKEKECSGKAKEIKFLKERVRVERERAGTDTLDKRDNELEMAKDRAATNLDHKHSTQKMQHIIIDTESTFKRKLNTDEDAQYTRKVACTQDSSGIHKEMKLQHVRGGSA
ncbi:hypothetical protein CC1G_05374 [Coprinopsis cinerea okayama7|uniref:Uncharacterized protein n=1 Tax=Coprinopsis cinerea (strain Okayama-7 / 130 / ATCC MYA-4618 / FGSC 9003) TaxID=240176 RepID=A8NPV6_COPC7|nr:hypothetical protein CC1G_05374 [Coprinopsis cinerea okayama7\|eukprot:XP_001835412.1 hypothetical protein CC1G_05374 [Coprinopsis cinerea okayama7\